MVLGIGRSEVPYGNGNRVSTYQEEGNTHRRIAPIEEFILIQTGTINTDNTYSFDFSVYGSPLYLLSFHVSNRPQRGGRIEFKINDQAGLGNQTISDFSLGTSQFPYAFTSVIIQPSYQMEIKPNYQIQRCTLIARQAAIIYTDQVSERADNGQLER